MPALLFQAGRHGWGLAPTCPQLSDDRFPKTNQAFFTGLQEEPSLFVGRCSAFGGGGTAASRLSNYNMPVSHWHSPTVVRPELVGMLAPLKWLLLKSENTFSLFIDVNVTCLKKNTRGPIFVFLFFVIFQCKAQPEDKAALHHLNPLRA